MKVATGLTVVLDIGKTLAKLSLWDSAGMLVAREARPNARIDAGTYVALDVEGITAWLEQVLSQFAMMGTIASIIPVGHGAGAAIVRDGALLVPPIDYEEPMSPNDRAEYDALRDDFAATGSPALPDGLNLGAQLFRLGKAHPGLFCGSTILLWPQYWAWLLSGVAASEVTSLGCHSDLWRPAEGQPSQLVQRMGWAAALPPLRLAGDVLGTITPEWSARTGLPVDVRIHVGIHDSNAALVAARGFPEIADHESTVLSTGTWFVAMRTPGANDPVDLAGLPEARDCLVNVDCEGRPIPSARFMGGREIETLIGIDTRRVDIKPDQPALLAAAGQVLADGAMLLPSFAPGFGPFPHGRGRWIAMPDGWIARRAAVCLYAALVADTALDLIGSRGRLLIEGRFAEAEVFARALARLRPHMQVYVSNAHNDVSYGALRLLDPSLQPASTLLHVVPLDEDLTHYKAIWHREAGRVEEAGA